MKGWCNKLNSIVMLEGKVEYKITLDPGVWIFDDRKVDLTTYFTTAHTAVDELEEYTKSVSKHWDREIREGAIYPPTLKTETSTKKEKLLNGTFGIPFRYFIDNAGPLNGTSLIIIETKKGEYEIPLEHAYQAILGFSNEGKPLRVDGPVHFYYGDGSNLNEPIKDIVKFTIE
jgi:hypothetical protein